MSKPILSLAKGIVVDRCQPSGLPEDHSISITKGDAEIMQGLGFDHIKLLFSPNSFMDGDALNPNALWYLDAMVDTVLHTGLPCLVCIHPEAAFKRDYLASPERFSAMLRFYRQWSAYLSRWSNRQVAFQLMTEPFANYTDWNELHPQIHQAVRAELPEHTLVLSGDRTGSMFGLLTLHPVEDDNVYYGFTSYDPFAFTLQSWNAFFGGVNEALNRVGRLPYPASPDIVERILPAVTKGIAPEWVRKAEEYVRAYGQGDYQQGNHGLFNRAWHDHRFSWINDWRKEYRGDFPVLCNEFGVMDPVMGRQYGGPGCLAKDRVTFVRDIRQSMEAHRIGWSYWSYNETFTIFDPENRTPYGPGDAAHVDANLLDALGLPLGRTRNWNGEV